MNERTSILQDIRSALAESGEPIETLPEIERETLGIDPEILTRRFVEEVEAVSGIVHRVTDVDAAARQLDILLTANKVTRLAVSRDKVARDVSARVLGSHEIIDPEGNRDKIASAEMGLSAARLAIAEHGTLMLVAEDDHGRLLSLLPPHHVVVLHENQITGTLQEALATLHAESIPATVTFVSGPSRTADIEQILVVGIHGPTRLDVILIEGQERDTEG